MKATNRDDRETLAMLLHLLIGELDFANSLSAFPAESEEITKACNALGTIHRTLTISGIGLPTIPQRFPYREVAAVLCIAHLIETVTATILGDDYDNPASIRYVLHEELRGMAMRLDQIAATLGALNDPESLT